jgi:Zn-dependent protease with chaperone function
VATGAAVFVAIGALFTFVSPYRLHHRPAEDPALLASAREYESELGVGRVPIRIEKVSDDTDQANAYAYGVGPSRRVVVWDTLLRRPFTKDEQRIVLTSSATIRSTTS